MIQFNSEYNSSSISTHNFFNYPANFIFFTHYYWILPQVYNMSALAEKIGTKLLVKFACGIASAAGEKAFEKGFEEFFGSDEKELENTIKAEIADVKKELKQVIDQVRDVKKSIDNLSSQLADSILQLRSDTLKGHLTKINSLYNSIIDNSIKRIIIHVYHM